MSTLQFVIDFVVRVQHWLAPVLPWLSSPWGRFYSLIFGLVWLSAIAWGPKAATHTWSDSEMSPFDLEVLQVLAEDFRSYHAARDRVGIQTDDSESPVPTGKAGTLW
jgi:hypothetical protein